MTRFWITMIAVIALFPYFEFLIMGDSVILPNKANGLEEDSEIICVIDENTNTKVCYKFFEVETN